MRFSLESDTLTRIPTGGVVGGHSTKTLATRKLHEKKSECRGDFLADQKRRNASGRHQEVVDGQMESEAIWTVPPLRSTGGPLKSTADRKCVSRYPAIYAKEGAIDEYSNGYDLEALNDCTRRPASFLHGSRPIDRNAKTRPIQSTSCCNDILTFHKCQFFSMALRSGSGGWYFPKTMRNTLYFVDEFHVSTGQLKLK
jgi:hypothetical protein